MRRGRSANPRRSTAKSAAVVHGEDAVVVASGCIVHG
jgi:hypothetical protein